MHKRHVVAAVEIIVHVNFPVAVESVFTPVEKMELLERQRLNHSGQAAQKIPQRAGMRIEIHEYEFLPDIHLHGHKSVLGAVKICHAFEFGHALQRAIEPVRPAVVRAAQVLGFSARLGHHCGSVVAADIEEGAQHPVIPANDHHRFTGYFCRKVSPWRSHLIGAARYQPVSAEYCLLLEFRHARVHVPGRGNRRGLLKRRRRIVERDDFLE